MVFVLFCDAPQGVVFSFLRAQFFNHMHQIFHVIRWGLTLSPLRRDLVLGPHGVEFGYVGARRGGSSSGGSGEVTVLGPMATALCVHESKSLESPFVRAH